MSKYLLDSYAWIEYFEGSEKGIRVKEILEKNSCATSALSISEVTIKLLKKGRNPAEGFQLMTTRSEILLVDEFVSFESGQLYIEKRKIHKDIGIVDVLIMTQARKNKLIIVTGDSEHFSDEENVLLI